MAILEAAILFDSTPIIERKYYDSEQVLNKEHRIGLLSAIDGFAREAFGDEISSFSLANYTLIVSSMNVSQPKNESNVKKLMMYCIVQKGMSEIVVKENMDKILDQFLNRFSRFELFNLDEKIIKKMQQFTSRIDDQFKDLALKPEDRFKKIFF